ncbi:uncharacterized protein LOC131693639 [Topomyia yanbarensis]|uniref:uncharacterized protein LOC131693639 n=1 Tax=Topomyia yanbarensis TaxID=2498891 RepID=UPI00273BBC6A|nr:uncharacterized protein LOC131693639 [Topomyia yanbarensis]
MRKFRINAIVIAVVLIGCQLVLSDADENETAVTESELVDNSTVDNQQQISLTEPIAYEEKDVTQFVDALKHQLRCGYPKFGIPSLVPLKLSYKFKTSLDFLNLKKIHVAASNFVIHGLDNFKWLPSNTSFTRTGTNLTVNFPNITVTADTSLNGVNGSSRLSLFDTLVFLESQYEEKDDLLYVTDLNGDLTLKAAGVKIAHLFPKSAKLTKIWNKAIGDSLPVVTKLITTRKISVEFINRLINGAKYYAMNTANSALSTYKLNFDGVVDSFKRFSEKTYDSLMCHENESVGQSRVM